MTSATRMRAIFDTSPAPFTPAGTRTYIENLATALVDRSDWDVFPAHLPHWITPDSAKGLRHKLKVMAWDSYYMQAVLPAYAYRAQAQVLHVPTFRIPFRTAMPVVATIFDVIPLLYPELFRLRDRIIINRYFRLCRQHAAYILTISEQTRHDLAERLNIDKRRIITTHLAAAPVFKPVGRAAITSVRARYKLGEHYILSVGTLEPRKNTVRVLHMFAALRKQRAIPHQLVLVGQAGWRDDPIYTTIRQLGLEDVVSRPGFVPPEDLPALYAGAAVFVYPSLYEGFGIPPLEAMACGCPVITSNTSSLPEVVGDAAITVDPYDTRALMHATAQILTNRAYADELRARGFAQAQRFSWERCAQATVDVYQQAMSNPRH